MQTTKTTRISALLPISLVEEVKKESQLKNIAQSHVVKKALEFWLEHKLARDAKELSEMNFYDLPSENDWLSIQSKIE